MKKIPRWLAFVFIIISIGCAHSQSDSSQTEKSLHDRVNAYLSARNSGNMTAEYQFLSPSYKSKVSLENFIKKRNIKFLKSVLQGIEYQPGTETAFVNITSSCQYNEYKIEGVRNQQTWQFLDSEWFLDVKRASIKTLFSPKKSASEK
jgi:hypothetical protein